TAVNILSRTRIFVFKAVELKLLRCVQSEDQETSSEGQETSSEDQEMSSEDQEASSEDREMSSDDELDLLDFILDKVHGTNLIRNLIALVLNGVLGSQGRPLTDPTSIRVRELAQSMYDDLCEVLPDLTPVKDDLAMALSIPQAEMAVEIRAAIRTHFGRMPELIVSKMKKIGRAPSTIPELDAEQDDDELAEDTDEEQDDTESGEDDKYRFPPGHILKWWSYLSKLPSEVQPVFCPTAGFSDTFKLFSENAVIALLWGTGNTPTRRIMDTVCKKKEAQKMSDD
ncbi:hypothetical protein BGZ98_006153, partial [Dissophora globulifera]